MSRAAVVYTARTKHAAKQNADGLGVYSYQSLLNHLDTLTRNEIEISTTGVTFRKLSDPTPVQHGAFELIEGSPLELK